MNSHVFLLFFGIIIGLTLAAIGNHYGVMTKF